MFYVNLSITILFLIYFYFKGIRVQQIMSELKGLKKEMEEDYQNMLKKVGLLYEKCGEMAEFVGSISEHAMSNPELPDELREKAESMTQVCNELRVDVDILKMTGELDKLKGDEDESGD